MLETRIKALFLVLAGLCCFHAQSAPSYLNIEMKDKSVEAYALADRPVLTFADGLLSVKGETLEASYPLADVARYFFSDEPAGVREAHAEADFGVSFLNPDNLSISAEGPINVAIFDLDGRLLKTQTGTDLIAVPMSDLGAGVFVVNVNNRKSIKIIRK